MSLIVPWDLTLVYIRTQYTTWKCLFFVFIKDANTRQWISLSLFKLECGPQEINCREIRLNLTFSTNWNKRGKVFGSFCRYRKALFFWSLGISLYLELFCFLSFITIVLRNLCSGTHRKNQVFKLREFILKVTFSLPSPSSILKRQQKREFTVFQTWSPLFHVIHFVKFWVNFSGRNLINPKGLYQSTGKEKENRCHLFTSSNKGEILIRHFHVVGRAKTAKKFTK